MPLQATLNRYVHVALKSQLVLGYQIYESLMPDQLLMHFHHITEHFAPVRCLNKKAIPAWYVMALDLAIQAATARHSMWPEIPGLGKDCAA